MYIHIDDKEKLVKKLVEGEEEYECITGEKGGSIIETTERDIVESIKVTEDEMHLIVTSDLLAVTIEIPNELVIEDLLQVTIKKMNKLKSMLETLK